MTQNTEKRNLFRAPFSVSEEQHSGTLPCRVVYDALGNTVCSYTGDRALDLAASICAHLNNAPDFEGYNLQNKQDARKVQILNSPLGKAFLDFMRSIAMAAYNDEIESVVHLRSPKPLMDLCRAFGFTPEKAWPTTAVNIWLHSIAPASLEEINKTADYMERDL